MNAPLDQRLVQPSKAEALINIPIAQRYLGLTIFVQDERKEYIFQNNVSNSGLIEKELGTSGSGDSTDGFTRKYISDNTNAVTGDYFLVTFDTNNNILVTLPSQPEDGNVIIVHDVNYECGLTKTITILGNGWGIGDVSNTSDPDDLVIDIPGIKVTLTFNNAVDSWDIDLNQVNIVHKDAAEGYYPPGIDLTDYTTRAEVKQRIKDQVTEVNYINFSLTFLDRFKYSYIFLPNGVTSIYVTTKFSPEFNFKLNIASPDMEPKVVSEDKNDTTDILELSGKLASFSITADSLFDEITLPVIFNCTVNYNPNFQNHYIATSIKLNSLYDKIQTILPIGINKMFVHGIYEQIPLASKLTMGPYSGTTSTTPMTISTNPDNPTDVSMFAGTPVEYGVIDMNTTSNLTVFGVYMDITL
jgi:hypothetical protein